MPKRIKVVHSGGKFMHQFKSLRKIILIFSFALVTFGCAANKAKSSSESIVVKANVTVKAEAVSEGICLTFNNIPPETTQLFIAVHEPFFKKEFPNPSSIAYQYTRIRDSVLEQVKKTGKVICPFVTAGQKYEIYVSFSKDDYRAEEYLNRRWDLSINTECTPYSGIHLDKSIDLHLNETYTSVTLSSEPTFSEEVCYAPEKYRYEGDIAFTTADFIGIPEESILEDKVNSLTWDFSLMYDDYKGWIASGDYHAYIKIYCNIIYDNVLWEVQVAKTKRFTFSL